MSKNISKFHYALIVLALLSLNIVEQAASVINATIPGMKGTFSNQSLVNIELITTIVSMFVTIFVLISGFVVKQIGQKNTAILGLAIASISSIIPAFLNDFNIIIISRAILGAGIGLANPLAISLIGVFFYGDQRAKLMGWRSAIAGLGTALMTFIAGQLLVFSWHASYLVYLLFIPTLLLFIFFVPDPVKSGAIKRQEQEQKKELQKAANEGNEVQQDSIALIAELTLLIFLGLVSAMIFFVKLPTFFVENNIGSPTQASNVLSLINISNVIGGFIFGICYKKLKKFILPFALGIGGIATCLISISRNMWVITIISILYGIVCSLSIPYIFNRISEVSSAKKAPFFTSIALVGSNLGSFLSPIIANYLGTQSSTVIFNAGLINIVTGVVTLIVIIATKEPRHHVHQKLVK